MAALTIEEIIRGVEQHLEVVRFGLEDMRTRPLRVRSGFLNVVVFGRTITFALQKLKNKVPDFDNWYSLHRESLQSNTAAKYLFSLRNSIEKEAHVPELAARGTFKLLSAETMKAFEPPPPNAVSFFMGDRNGGSGWMVRMNDGSEEPYYMDLPPEVGQIELMLQGFPRQHGGSEPSAITLATEYADLLAEIVRDARRQFMPR